MCISYLGQKVTTWVSRDDGDRLGQTQVITSYYLGQSYHLGGNKLPFVNSTKSLIFDLTKTLLPKRLVLTYLSYVQFYLGSHFPS